MATIVEKIIGTGGDYVALQAWSDAAPANLTLNESATTGAGSTTSSIQLNAASSATAGAYVGNTLLISGEKRLITAYDTTTKIATVGALNGSAATFSAAPASDVAYTIGDVIWRGKLKKQEFSSGGTLLTISGKTVDATHYFELTTDAGASFLDHADKATNPLRYDATKGAAMRVNDESAFTIHVQLPYTRISKLQFSSASAGANAAGPVVATVPNVTIDQCIIESLATNYIVLGAVKLSEPGTSIRNSIIIQKSTNIAAYLITLANGASAYNCTFVSLGAALTNGIRTEYAPAVMKNCYVGGVVAPEDGTSVITKTNCYSNATATGYSVAPLSTANFVSVTNGTHDLRKAAGSVLIDAGVTEATYSATDILGYARPSGTAYDVGADEYQAAVAADTTAPTLTTPTGAQTGATTGSGTVVTDEGNGTLYYLASINAVETAATVKASGATQVIASAGSKSVTVSGLTASTVYYLHYVHRDTAGNDSAVVHSASFTTAAAPAADTTAPVLASPTATATTSSTATGTVATDEGGGTLYYLATANATETAATIKATGGTQAVSATGTRTVSLTGLTPGATYYLHFVQTDAAGNDSNVVNSASFIPPAADTTAPVQTGSITPGAITSSSVAFSYPAATDNVAVIGYEISKDSGANWVDNGTGLNGSFTGLAAVTTYPIWVRAYDNGSPRNYSTPLQLNMTTSAASGGTITTPMLKNNAGTLLASLTGITAYIYKVSDGTLVVTKTAQSTNSSGVMVISDAAILPGTQYRTVIVLGTGDEGMDKVTAS
jgi:hypothetical protein